MTTTIRVQAAFANQSGLPADIITNTWHFTSVSVDPLTDASFALNDLEAFYNVIDGIYSTAVTGAITLKAYNLSDPEPRVPMLETDISITTATGAILPNECAICLSYHGVLTSGTPAARRRGRIYLGPLDATVLDEGPNDGRVQASTCSLIAGAAAGLIAAGDPGNRQWAIFSPTIAGSPPWTTSDLIFATLPVTNGYIDNAFDTVRSRGTAPSTRTLVIP